MSSADYLTDVRGRYGKQKSAVPGLQSRFSTVCPQCSNVVHAARSVCNSCQFDMKEYRLKKKMDKQEKNVSRGQHKRQHNHVHGIWSKINEYMEQLYGAGYACVLLYANVADRQRSHYGYRCSVKKVDDCMAKPLGRAVVNGFRKVVEEAFPAGPNPVLDSTEEVSLTDTQTQQQVSAEGVIEHARSAETSVDTEPHSVSDDAEEVSFETIRVRGGVSGLIDTQQAQRGSAEAGADTSATPLTSSITASGTPRFILTRPVIKLLHKPILQCRPLLQIRPQPVFASSFQLVSAARPEHPLIPSHIPVHSSHSSVLQSSSFPIGHPNNNTLH